MTEQIFDHGPAWGDNRRLATSVSIIGAAWIAGVVALAVAGGFDVPADRPALPTLIAIAVPVLAFGLTVTVSPRLRALVRRRRPATSA